MKKFQLQSADKSTARGFNIEEAELLKEIQSLNNEIKKLKSRKKYGLVWEDKPEKVVNICKEKLPVLVEDKEREIKTDKNKPVNIIIEGDNYHSLSVLNYTHRGKIDVIYIDPPYNTGNENWIYNDRKVDAEDSFRHSKWLSFMEKRLNLAKYLLSKSGVVFISINDIELSQLKLLCDEIFGEKNVEIMIWYKIPEEGTAGQGKMKITHRFRLDHEYILTCYKDRNSLKFNKPLRLKKVKNDYGNLDNDPRGDWMSCEICKSDNKSNEGGKNYYAIETTSGRIIKRQWHISHEEFLNLDKDKRIYWGSGKSVPRLKKFLGEPQPTTPSSIITNISQTEANNELKKIFGNKEFDNPKPLSLIKWILEISSKKESVILDFFAGSGTTGHAVLDLNKGDNGNRKFILCTNDENHIATEICYPRLKKAINGYRDIKGLGGNLKYYKTDFVDNKITDANKKKLVDKSTEMLCLKEDCFELIKKGQSFKIFKDDKDKYLGIVYDDAGIEMFKKEVGKLNKTIITYVFSLDDSAREEEFESIQKLVELKPIPTAILNIYKKIFK